MTAKEILADIEYRGTRYKCVGGPLDGEEIASYLYVKTGRGKRTTHISIPLMPESFEAHTDGGESGTYAWHDERRQYWWQSGALAPMRAPDASRG